MESFIVTVLAVLESNSFGNLHHACRVAQTNLMKCPELGSAPKIEEFQKAENKPAARLQIEQLLLELYCVVKKKAQGFY